MRFKHPAPAQEAAWREWLESRPPAIREAVERLRLDPWTLYRLRSTGQRVFILAISEPREDGKVTCRVGVTGQFNLVTHERAVFGIEVDDLEECDLPAEGELLGSQDLPIDVLKQLHRDYPEGPPLKVRLELVRKYPLRKSSGEEDQS